jgi:ADP-heptose:LPS heptosyltransferase
MIDLNQYTHIILTILKEGTRSNQAFRSLVESLVPTVAPIIEQYLDDKDSKNFSISFANEVKRLNLSLEAVAAQTYDFVLADEKLLKTATDIHERLVAYNTRNTEEAWRKVHSRPHIKYDIVEETKYLTEFGKQLSCGLCRKAYDGYLKSNPPTLETKEAYVKWLRTAHNQVQLVNGKAELTDAEFESRYPVPELILLKSSLSLGDIVMMTAAVRDLHKLHPGKYLTAVSTSCGDVWNNNPYITKIKSSEGVRTIDIGYPLINESNTRPYHFVHGYIRDLASKLGVVIEPTLFKGDIHLSTQEKEQYPFDENKPYWIIVAGGKYDYTIKWWELKRYQEVVDYFKDKIQFVQVGAQGHNHQGLTGVIDIRGRTTHRQLIQLVYHADGVLCPVTSLMHLAAAVPTKKANQLRPCVVVAGGREAPHWEAYPNHQFLHTVGALPCCSNGGCWKSRTKALGDGEALDKAICSNTVGDLPKCMDMITSKDVIRAIETYYNGGVLKYLNTQESQLDFLEIPHD